jgi:hypothetical protein
MKLKYLMSTILFFIHFTLAASPLELPKEGGLFGAYVDAGPLSDTLETKTIIEFETQIQKKLAWVYFSNNWLNGQIIFPRTSVESAINANTIPYIRLLPWSEVRASGPDPVFNMDVLLSNQYDLQLILWAHEAKKLNTHYIIEFGPEVNGEWFAWNGKWNGAGSKDQYGDPNLHDGAEKFAAVFRKIVTLFREVGLTNVTWVLHLDTGGTPTTSWNKAKNYYPGDEYVDWIGLSVFGAQLPTHKWINFEDKFKYFWPQIKELAEKKPLIISEFAVIEDKNDPLRKTEWLKETFDFIESQEFPIRAVTYWNSPGWLADGSADFRVTSSPTALDFVQKRLKTNYWIINP